MATPNAPRKKGGTANKDGPSHHTFSVNRGSQSATDARPSSAPTGTKQILPIKRYNILGPISSTPGQSSGSVKEKEPVSRGAEEQYRKKRAWENENVERDKEKAEWDKEKAEWEMETANLQRRETRQLQVENKYLKLILEDLHKSIIVGEAKLEIELKPPEDIKNDKLLIELTNNTRNVHLKFNELEKELDYLHRTISQINSIIAGDDRSKDPFQVKTNTFTATGRQPKRNPNKTFEQREQFSNIDKDIELLTSTWRELSASKQEMANKIEENQHNYEKVWAEHQNLKTSFTALQKSSDEANAGAEEQNTNKSACENANVERDKEKAEWEMETANLQRSLEEEKHKTKTNETFWANKMKELQEKNEILTNGMKDNEALQTKCNQLEQDLERLTNGMKDNEELQKKCNQREQDLESERERLRVKIKELEERLTNGMKDNEELQKKYNHREQDLESERERLRVKIEELEERLSNGMKDNEALQKKCNQLEKDLEREFNQKKKEWEKHCKKLTKKHTNEAEQLHKTIKSLMVEKDKLLTSLEEEKHKTKTNETFWAYKMKELQEKNEREFNQEKKEWEKYCKKLTKKHTNETEQLHKTINSLTVDNDTLLTRLSTIASDRFTHDNVNVADLSDADRPTKLQEVYSELYDNEWTDAFEELTTHDNITDDDAIMILLKILMSSFHKCREVTWGRYERLKNVASSVYIEEEISMPSPKVMSNVSEPVLTTQEADSSRTQLDKNDEKVDQTSDTDNNLDTMQDGTESRESGENKGMHVVNEKAFKVIDVKVNVDSGHSSSIGKPKDIFEKEDGKNVTKENVATGDTNVSEASTDISEDKKRKFQNGASKNEASEDQSMREASNDKFESKKGKNGANENEKSDDQSVSEATKDKSDNKMGKNGASENEKSDDQSVSEAPKDKYDNTKGKHLLCTIDLNFDLMHDIKDIWRKTTLELKGIAAEPLYSVIERCLDMPFIGQPMISKYLKSCIALCWKMGVQQRPLHLDGFAEMDAYAGKKFDKDKFRAYTQSGSHVAFFVWPTLYLYEGGPILVKGIVQCCPPVEAKHEEPS